MKLTILGANGKTGRLLVRQAVAAGHEVVGLVRSKANAIQLKGYTAVIGDATRASDIVRASQGSDAVISTLGIISNRTHLMTDAYRAVIAASQQTGIRRFIVESAYTVQPERIKPLLRLVTRIVMGGMVADKKRGEILLQQSDLDWTLARPVTLTNGRGGKTIRVLPASEQVGFRHVISRADTAAWMLQAAENGTFVRDDPIISQ